jgi:TM2 domain-containing membrane protein YozV
MLRIWRKKIFPGKNLYIFAELKEIFMSSCPGCNGSGSKNNSTCPYCGGSGQVADRGSSRSSSYSSPSYSSYGSDKSWGVLVVLSILLGWLGADRFYAGRFGLGILKALSMLVGIGTIWWIIDVLLAITGKQEDACGDYISGGKSSGCISKLIGTAIVAIIAIVVLFNAVPDFESALNNVIDKARTALYELTGNDAAPDATTIVGKTATVTSKNLLLHVGPSADSKKIKILKQGDTLTIIGAPYNGWTPVKHGKNAGYVSSGLIAVKR